VPKYIVDEINALGGNIQNAYGISLSQLKTVAECGIGKINVDTDIRLAVTRNLRELFAKRPFLQASPSVGAVYDLLDKKREAFDPRVFLPPIMETVMHGVIPDEDVASVIKTVECGVKEVVGTLIVEFGMVGKGPLVALKTLEEMADFYRREEKTA
jgi:fructose-bisphosphate aldolase class II